MLKTSSQLTDAVKQMKLQMRKKAADSSVPADPTGAGTVSIPTQPDAEDPAKLGLPGGAATNPTMGAAADNKLLTVTNPAPSGAGHVPAVDNGTARDEAATGSLREKMATLSTGIQAFLSKKASTPAAAQPAAAAQTSAATSAATSTATPVEADEAIKAANLLYQNIGAMVCADANGQAFVQDMLLKQAGEERAQLFLKEATDAALVYQHAGAIYHAEQQKQASEAAAIREEFLALPPAQQKVAANLATAQQAAIKAGHVTNDFEHYFFLKGAAAAEEMMAPGPEGAAPPDMGAAPLPGADGQPDPQVILAAIQEAVESGQMTEEEAIKVLTELGLAPPGAEGGAGAPAEDLAAADPAMKAAANALQLLLTEA